MSDELPDGSTWVRVDDATLTEMVVGISRSNLMRSEPDNSGFTFETACSVLSSLAQEDEDISGVIPYDFCY